MLRPRIEAIELHFGCHDGSWQLPEGTSPIVIAGANGTGKTTLVEGLLACLFGPGGRTDVAALDGGDARHGPDAVWRTGGTRDGEWARVRVVRNGERFDIRRDFDRGTVVIRATHDDDVRYEGRTDTRARPDEAGRQRQVLADLIGIGDRDTYVHTLFVRQGHLPATTLSDHLLRVAAGGHARIEVARAAIIESHREVTARPIAGSAPAATDARELERVEAELAGLERRLDAARAAGARRGPLTLDRDRMGEQLRRLSAEIDLLEEVHAALARGSAIEISARQVRELSRSLEQARGSLKQIDENLASAADEAAAAMADGLYPPDLPERLARAELRWRDLERLGTPTWLAWLAGALVVAAAVLFVLVPTPWPAGVAGAAAVAAAAAWLSLWLQVRRTREGLRAGLAATLDGVPHGDRLGPADVALALQRFVTQRETDARRAEARADLAAALRQARSALRQAAAAGVTTTVAEPAAPARRPSGRRSVHMILTRIEATLGRVSDQILRERREMERVGDASLRLPDGVVPSEAGVAQALRERRAERRRVQDALQEAGQELLERGTPAESLDALEAALATLRPRRDELVRKARVLEAAHALLDDGYAAFRDRDQERLVRLVSDQVKRLTDGALGPVIVGDDLGDTKVRVGQRVMAPTSPPLGFGDIHALSLGVRLGAAAFLGSMGVYPPLILDDPFAHLDPDRARSVWRILEAVARDRQVIVTTQDALLLDALDVEPDIVLVDRFRKSVSTESAPGRRRQGTVTQQ